MQLWWATGEWAPTRPRCAHAALAHPPNCYERGATIAPPHSRATHLPAKHDGVVSAARGPAGPRARQPAGAHPCRERSPGELRRFSEASRSQPGLSRGGTARCCCWLSAGAAGCPASDLRPARPATALSGSAHSLRYGLPRGRAPGAARTGPRQVPAHRQPLGRLPLGRLAAVSFVLTAPPLSEPWMKPAGQWRPHVARRECRTCTAGRGALVGALPSAARLPPLPCRSLVAVAVLTCSPRLLPPHAPQLTGLNCIEEVEEPAGSGKFVLKVRRRLCEHTAAGETAGAAHPPAVVAAGGPAGQVCTHRSWLAFPPSPQIKCPLVVDTTINAALVDPVRPPLRVLSGAQVGTATLPAPAVVDIEAQAGASLNGRALSVKGLANAPAVQVRCAVAGGGAAPACGGLPRRRALPVPPPPACHAPVPSPPDPPPPRPPPPWQINTAAGSVGLSIPNQGGLEVFGKSELGVTTVTSQDDTTALTARAAACRCPSAPCASCCARCLGWRTAPQPPRLTPRSAPAPPARAAPAGHRRPRQRQPGAAVCRVCRHRLVHQSVPHAARCGGVAGGLMGAWRMLGRRAGGQQEGGAGWLTQLAWHVGRRRGRRPPSAGTAPTLPTPRHRGQGDVELLDAQGDLVVQARARWEPLWGSPALAWRNQPRGVPAAGSPAATTATRALHGPASTHPPTRRAGHRHAGRHHHQRASHRRHHGAAGAGGAGPGCGGGGRGQPGGAGCHHSGRRHRRHQRQAGGLLAGQGWVGCGGAAAGAQQEALAAGRAAPGGRASLCCCCPDPACLDAALHPPCRPSTPTCRA